MVFILLLHVRTVTITHALMLLIKKILNEERDSEIQESLHGRVKCTNDSYLDKDKISKKVILAGKWVFFQKLIYYRIYMFYLIFTWYP